MLYVFVSYFLRRNSQNSTETWWSSHANLLIQDKVVFTLVDPFYIFCFYLVFISLALENFLARHFNRRRLVLPQKWTYDFIYIAAL